MINLLTDLKQAFSRNRCKANINYNRCIFIFDVNKWSKTEKELLADIEQTEKEITINCALLNKLKSGNKDEYNATCKRFRESKIFAYYSLFVDDVWQINRLAFNADKYFILETRRQFEKNIKLPYISDDDIIIKKPVQTNPFSYASILAKYQQSINNKEIVFTDDEKATEYYKLIDSYYKHYKAFTDNITYCRKMVECYNDNWLKIFNDARHILKVQRYKLTDLKKILNQIYIKYNIKRKAKETDLNEFKICYHQTTIKGYKYIYIDKI